MSIKSSNFECNKIMSQDEEVVALYSYGELVYENDYPYIAGHVTDGSSTFTFRVNNADVTVNVGANGWWKWKQNVVLTTLSRMIISNVVDEVIFSVVTDNYVTANEMFFGYYGLNSLKKITILKPIKVQGNISYMISCCPSLEEVVGTENILGKDITSYRELFSQNPLLRSPLDFHNIKPSVTADSVVCNSYSPYCTNVTSMYLYDITRNMVNIPTHIIPNVVDFNIDLIEQSVSFSNNSLLTYQSMLNIANALCDNNNTDEQLTITFNSTAWNALTEEQKDTIALIFLDKNWTIATA